MAIIKSVSFKDKEEEMLKYLKDKDFSYYVKGLIKKDMLYTGFTKKKEDLESELLKNSLNLK